MSVERKRHKDRIVLWVTNAGSNLVLLEMKLLVENLYGVVRRWLGVERCQAS